MTPIIRSKRIRAFTYPQFCCTFYFDGAESIKRIMSLNKLIITFSFQHSSLGKIFLYTIRFYCTGNIY